MLVTGVRRRGAALTQLSGCSPVTSNHAPLPQPSTAHSQHGQPQSEQPTSSPASLADQYPPNQISAEYDFVAAIETITVTSFVAYRKRYTSHNINGLPFTVYSATKETA
jgi:hypothetical protein